MVNSSKKDEGPVQLNDGQVIAGRWKVIKKLGEGGCGAVYQVEHTQTKQLAALKAESNFTDGGSVLKIEVDILSRLKGKKHVTELLYAAKRSKYQFIVMSLLGESLDSLRLKCGKVCSVSTQLRVGIHVLFGLKQIHDVGYIHRDLKPPNLAIGRPGCTDPKIIYILDFGLAREYVQLDPNGTYKLRRPRKRVLFRGTPRYCSASVNAKNEQCRADDLWSLLYVLVELRDRLPWNKLKEKEELRKAKQSTPDEELLSKSPPQFHQFIAHLRTLDYWKRPDYALIYGCFTEAMREGGYRFSDPWDWDRDSKRAPAVKKESNASAKAGKSEKGGKDAEKTQVDDDCNPFVDSDFSSNPLGL